MSKIKENVSSENWILRVSNIKKVLEGLSDVYESILGYSMISTASSFPKPDALLIGKECNPSEMAKLLQLILGAAVNCDNKEWYIANIMKLDTDTQIAVKNAIESLFISIGESTVSSGRARSSTADSMISLSFSDAINTSGDALSPDAGAADASAVHQLKREIDRLNHDLSLAVESKEKVTQELFDLKRELKTMREENNQLNSENEILTCKLQRKSSHSSGNNVLSAHDASVASLSEPSDASLKEAHVAKLQNQIERLKEDLFKMENSREEVRVKNDLLEKERLELKRKNEELQRRANEARNLKDELDIHKQLSEKAEKYEATIEVYKKKLEEAAEFRRKFKVTADDKNISESKLKISLEEEMRKNSSLKITNDNLKKQIQELTTSLATVTHRADSSDIELNLMKQKLNALSENKEHLAKELEEAKRTISRLEAGDRHKLVLEDELDHENGNQNALSFELKTNESERKITQLESENVDLKKQLDDLKKRMKNNPTESCEGTSGHSSFRMNASEGDGGVITRPAAIANQNISSDPADVHKLIESLNNEVYHWKDKVSRLEGALFKKREEIAEMDLRYKRCVNKAKQVAKVLEPIRSTSSNSSISSMANLEQLTLDLSAKEKTIQELEAENAKINQLKEVEERLMTVAFHSLVRLTLLFFILPSLHLFLPLIHRILLFPLFILRVTLVKTPVSLISSSSPPPPSSLSPPPRFSPP